MTVKKSKKIGLDLDGVIIDLSAEKIALAQKFGVELSISQTPANVFRDVVSDGIRQKIQSKLHDDPSIALNLPLMTGVFASLERIKKSGHLLYLISQRKNQEMAVNLLKAKNLWPDFFSNQNTFFVRDEAEKAVIGKKLGIDCYVDDWLTVLELFPFVKNRFLFDPIGVYSDKKGNYKIVSSWSELISYLAN